MPCERLALAEGGSEAHPVNTLHVWQALNFDLAPHMTTFEPHSCSVCFMIYAVCRRRVVYGITI